jgi:hypothetical protein
MHRAAAVLVLCLLFISDHAGAPRATSRDEQPAVDPLRRWLSGLVISVPTVSLIVHVPLLGDLNATLENLVCRDLALSTMSGHDTCSDTRPQLSVAAQGVGLSCQGDWAYKEVAHPEKDGGGGKVSVAVEQADASFQLSLLRSATGAGLVSSAALDQCVVHTKPKLHFEGGGALNTLLKIFTSTIQDLLPSVIQTQGCAFMEGLVATNLTAVLSEINADMQPFLNPPHFPPPAAAPAAGRVDLRRAALTGLLDYAIDELVAPQLNTLLGDLTHGTGELDVPGLPLALPLTLPGLATLDLTLVALKLGGLNSWRVPPAPGAKPIFQTVGPETMSFCAALDRLSVTMSFRVGVKPLNGTIQAGTLVENGTLSANFTALEIASRLGLGINEARRAALTIPERRTPSCIISILDTASLNATRLNISGAELALSVHGEGTERDLDQVIDSVFHLATCSFDKAIAPFLNAFLLDTVATSVNNAFEDYRESPSDQCVPPPEVVPEFGWGGTIVAAVLFAVAASASWFKLSMLRALMQVQKIDGGGEGSASGGRFIRHRESSQRATEPLLQSINATTTVTKQVGAIRATAPALVSQADLIKAAAARGAALHAKPLIPPTAGASDEAVGEDSEAEAEAEGQELSVDSLLCLGLRDYVPAAIQYGMPTMLLLNGALFLASNTSSGASVAVVISLGEERIESGSLFDFALTNSVHDMWDAKVYPLALLIAVFSGAWPYLKILMLLACWWVPTGWMSATVRERILMAVDALGKWSLIDNYVLVLLMVAFSFHLELSDSAQAQPPSAVDVYVNPQRGFYLFILATVLSLVLTHIMLHYERSGGGSGSGGVSGGDGSASAAAETAVALRDQAASIAASDGDSGSETAAAGGTWRDVLLTPALASSIVLQLVGASVYSFRFTFGGLVAYLLELVNPSLIDTSYSLLSLGVRIPEVSDPALGSLGPLVIQAVFYIFALVTPIVQLVVLLALWYVPLRLRRQFQLYVVAEILHAWSGLEVFVVAVLAALLELKQFVGFIVDPYCAKPDFGLPIAIDTALQEVALPELRGDNNCFDVTAQLDAGCWLLFAASVLSVLVSRYVLHECHHALEARGKGGRGMAAGAPDPGAPRRTVPGSRLASPVGMGSE